MIANVKERLIAIREALGLSQRDFCKGIFVSQSYYAQLESERKPLNERICALICSIYGISKEYLQTGEGEMFSEQTADIQLNQLLEVFNELDPPFRDYVVMQINNLLEAQNRNKKRGKG
jgi:transcriptional regulator with XRE-family HTH domain